MSARYAAVMLMVPVIAASLFAGPKIEFDTKTFQCGDVIEGKTDKLNAVFIVRNTGNATLKLTSVRPGCGCTVVKYDSLVEPGKSVKIEATVNISNTRAGTHISKNITVTSNAAENDANVRLGIEANVVAVIDVSEVSLNFSGSDTAKARTVILSSKKTDLKVLDVNFQAPNNPNMPEWQKDIPLPFKYTLTPTDSIRPDGWHIYKLALYSPRVESAIPHGEIVIKTNHPDKPEIRITTDIGK